MNELLSLVAGRSVSGWVKAQALTAAGYLATNQGDLSMAESPLAEALGLWGELGNGPGIANTLVTLGTLAQNRDESTRADALKLRRLAARPMHQT